MSIYRVRLNWIIGTIFALIFVFLLGIRLGIFQKGGNGNGEDRANDAQIQTDREIWMNILQKEEKIGYVHRQFSKTAEGYKLLEAVFMRINTLGMVQDIRFKTRGNLHHDLTLSSFDFELQSSLSRFKVRGMLNGRILTLLIGAPGSEQKMDLPLEKDIFLPVSILEVLVHENVKPGESRTFHVFDPATTAQ